MLKSKLYMLIMKSEDPNVLAALSDEYLVLEKISDDKSEVAKRLVAVISHSKDELIVIEFLNKLNGSAPESILSDQGNQRILLLEEKLYAITC